MFASSPGESNLNIFMLCLSLFVLGLGVKVGQNYYWNTNFNWTYVIERWHAEKQYFEYGTGANPAGETITHYTQVLTTVKRGDFVYRTGTQERGNCIPTGLHFMQRIPLLNTRSYLGQEAMFWSRFSSVQVLPYV